MDDLATADPSLKKDGIPIADVARELATREPFVTKPNGESAARSKIMRCSREQQGMRRVGNGRVKLLSWEQQGFEGLPDASELKVANDLDAFLGEVSAASG